MVPWLISQFISQLILWMFPKSWGYPTAFKLCLINLVRKPMVTWGATIINTQINHVIL